MRSLLSTLHPSAIFRAGSNVFKKEQRVMVLKLHNNQSDGEGIVLGPSRDQRQFKGQWMVDIGRMVMNISADRIVDYVEYWKAKKAK